MDAISIHLLSNGVRWWYVKRRKQKPLKDESGRMYVLSDAAIPHDLLDSLKKKGMEKIVVDLENYTILSPDVVPLDEKGRVRLQEVMDKER